MSAMPFGGHPTFGQYIAWAYSVGCKIQTGYTTDEDGRPHSMTVITAPSGKWVVDVGMQHDEYLVPTTISRFDRRLGLQSPFFSLPHPDDQPQKPAQTPQS